MKSVALNPRQIFLEFDREKLKRILRIMVILQILIFAFFYYHLRNPLRVAQQYMPGVVGVPQYLYSMYGPFGDSMDKPMDVTVVGRQIYVSDTGNSKIRVFDYNGNHVNSFGERGTEPGQLRFPYGIAENSQGQILVADMYNGNISVFTPDGTFLHYFGASVDLESPAGLAIIDGRVYVTDVAQHKVIVFDEEGEKIFEFGEEGDEPGQFLSPNAITVSGTYVAVSDTGNHRIQIFNRMGNFIDEITHADGRNFVNPRGVGYTSRGELLTVNNMTHQTYIFNPNGEFQHILGQQGQGPGENFLPNGLYIDDQGRIYITDTSNRRVNVYQ
ncbi:6-bladed beta-propeller [Dethiobacter alkaliphilus]|uniref:NHL repeat containing protein n=1 Tax=Dethiobacter alkaliphilus AHT 1 TaxID=555088 RepID=C0GF36_DETAL|nr:6-bladed beta-propeller [Dethiobacter alkaliphilus]EEG78218.1 NHL repeat containing protein [Dethiobacter alkaliphilus AHT 1]